MNFDYQLDVLEFTELNMQLKITFEDPLSISIGAAPDKIRFELIRPELFTSQLTGLSVENGTVLEAEIPRQVSSKDEYEVLRTTGNTIKVFTDTAFAI